MAASSQRMFGTAAKDLIGVRAQTIARRPGERDRSRSSDAIAGCAIWASTYTGSRESGLRCGLPKKVEMPRHVAALEWIAEAPDPGVEQEMPHHDPQVGPEERLR